MKSGENWSGGSEKKTFKDFMVLYLYIAQGQGQIDNLQGSRGWVQTFGPN